MHKAVAKEGPRAPLFYLGAVILLALNSIAAGQTVEQSDLERCARQETAELKLACFEALADPESTDAETAAAPEVAASPDSATTEKALVTTGAAAAVAAQGTPDERVAEEAESADSVTDEAAIESVATTETAAAEVIAEEAVTETVVITESRAEELGTEHLDVKNVEQEDDADVRLMVREVVKGNYGVLYFHFKNDQIWRQVEPRRFGYPRNQEFEVIISRGMMGDYRLRVAGNSPMTAIRRLQ